VQRIQNLIRFGKSILTRHHRQAIVDRASNPKYELDFVNDMLEKDSKNYHCWQYRQWLVQHYSLWEQEFVDIERLIDEDVGNNSAWNQLYFCISRDGDLGVESANAQVNYIKRKILLDPMNECPWNYLQGYYKTEIVY
jgi:protein farnesyltransferase/geranylgeranyltransferase type-1 subunit alpha